MTREARHFYRQNFGSVDKFYSAGKRRGISREAVNRACQIVYDAHIDNPYRSLVILGQRVLAVAKTVYIEQEETTDARITKIETTLERHLLPWWKKVLDWYVGNYGENNS